MFNDIRFILIRYQRKTSDEMFSCRISSNTVGHEEYRYEGNLQSLLRPTRKVIDRCIIGQCWEISRSIENRVIYSVCLISSDLPIS
jgi:hypothetical protein